MEILHLASSTLCGLFILLLLTKPKRSQSDGILMGWFTLLLTHTFTFYLQLQSEAASELWLNLTDALAFGHAPLLWLYVRSLTEGQILWRPAMWWHAVPAALGLAILLPVAWGWWEESPGLRLSLTGAKLLQILIYGLWSLGRLRRFRTMLPEAFSSTDRVDLAWLRLLLWGLLIIWGITTVSLSLHFGLGVKIPYYGGLFTNLSVSLFVLVLGYSGLRQTAIFLPTHLVERLESEKKELADTGPVLASAPKYERSGLASTEASHLWDRLQAHMAAQQPYLDPQLSLGQLAKALGVPSNHLSQVINTYAQQNFFDYVNQYRVEAVKQRMALPEADRLTLLGLALDCGFNSKASFNRAFKKFTGQTPSEYRQKGG